MIGKIRALILKTAIVNPLNDQEIQMQCRKCGKHSWVQVGTVAMNEKHHRATPCSACRGRMIILMRKECDPHGLVSRV
jgi:Zn finger protein HypA/HybF involved in hydrogenase expression